MVWLSTFWDSLITRYINVLNLWLFCEFAQATMLQINLTQRKVCLSWRCQWLWTNPLTFPFLPPSFRLKASWTTKHDLLCTPFKSIILIELEAHPFPLTFTWGLSTFRYLIFGTAMVSLIMSASKPHWWITHRLCTLLSSCFMCYENRDCQHRPCNCQTVLQTQLYCG